MFTKSAFLEASIHSYMLEYHLFSAYLPISSPRASRMIKIHLYSSMGEGLILSCGKPVLLQFWVSYGWIMTDTIKLTQDSGWKLLIAGYYLISMITPDPVPVIEFRCIRVACHVGLCQYSFTRIYIVRYWGKHLKITQRVQTCHIHKLHIPSSLYSFRCRKKYLVSHTLLKWAINARQMTTSKGCFSHQRRVNFSKRIKLQSFVIKETYCLRVKSILANSSGIAQSFLFFKNSDISDSIFDCSLCFDIEIHRRMNRHSQSSVL